MARKCKECNRFAQRDSEYCWDCDPRVPAAEKKAARRKGGYHSRIIPHDLKSEDVLPIQSPQDLKRLLNLMLGKSIDNLEDTATMVKVTLPIVDKFSEIFQIELIEEMSHRLKLIEAKQQGRLLDATSDDSQFSHSD